VGSTSISLRQSFVVRHLVAKRRDSPYEPGLRRGSWLKMRFNCGQEFVIAGYMPGGFIAKIRTESAEAHR
jgi:hypothetical protein